MESKSTSSIPAYSQFLVEKQAVTHLQYESLLLKSNFLSTCDCILTLHSIFIKLYFFSLNYLHPLIRDVSNR